jgi:predicted LPLAT superfamily acyltransferase
LSGSSSWHEKEERGSSLGIRITVWVYRALGRPLARLILIPIVSYFFVFGRRERQASRRYLDRLYAAPGGAEALGHPPGLRDVYRHIYEFGAMVLDRIGFWLGGPDDFEIEVHGWDELDRVAREGRGAIFLGSHLGNFDSMRLLAHHRSPIAVHVLMFIEHAERINAVLRQLSGADGSDRPPPQVIPITPGSVQHALEVRAKIQRGEVVAILADRVHPNEADRTTRVDFLGASAALPEGPFLLAGTLRCPVLMMTSLRTGPGRYEIFVERMGDSLSLPRGRRQQAVQEHAQDFAHRLEAKLLLAPHQWFNFFDFWAEQTVDPQADGP